MHHATLLTIVAAAALGAIAQDASSLGDLYESIHISSSDGSEQLYVSPMYIVTTDNTKSRNPAKFSITEWETLWNGEARCQFNMPFLTCHPRDPMTSGDFVVEEDSTITLDGNHTFWACHPDVLLRDWPDLKVDVRTLILDYENGPHYAEGMESYCEEISFTAKGSPGTDVESDADDDDSDESGERDDQDEGAAATATASDTDDTQSSETTSSTGTGSQAAAVETDSTSGVNRETGSLGIAFLGLVLSVTAGPWVI